MQEILVKSETIQIDMVLQILFKSETNQIIIVWQILVKNEIKKMMSEYLPKTDKLDSDGP